MDHGAVGTAMIGLDAVGRAQELSDMPVAWRTRRGRGHAVRVAVAVALRGLADLVQPRWVEPPRRFSSPYRL